MHAVFGTCLKNSRFRCALGFAIRRDRYPRPIFINAILSRVSHCFDTGKEHKTFNARLAGSCKQVKSTFIIYAPMHLVVRRVESVRISGTVENCIYTLADIDKA